MSEEGLAIPAPLVTPVMLHLNDTSIMWNVKWKSSWTTVYVEKYIIKTWTADKINVRQDEPNIVYTEARRTEYHLYGGKTNRISFIREHLNAHHNTELKTWRHVFDNMNDSNLTNTCNNQGLIYVYRFVYLLWQTAHDRQGHATVSVIDEMNNQIVSMTQYKKVVRSSSKVKISSVYILSTWTTIFQLRLLRSILWDKWSNILIPTWKKMSQELVLERRDLWGLMFTPWGHDTMVGRAVCSHTISSQSKVQKMYKPLVSYVMNKYMEMKI